jgi:DnaJ-class molecular chaperone
VPGATGPTNQKEIVMCDNNQPQPQPVVVNCKVCGGTGRKGTLGLACNKCNGTGKQILR